MVNILSIVSVALLVYYNLVNIYQVQGDWHNGFTGNSTEEEDPKLYLVNGTALLDELNLLNSHVRELLKFLNDSSRDEEPYGMKIAHVYGEMMNIHDRLAELRFDEDNMKFNLTMTDGEIDRAKHLYFDSITSIYNFNKIFEQ